MEKVYGVDLGSKNFDKEALFEQVKELMPDLFNRWLTVKDDDVDVAECLERGHDEFYAFAEWIEYEYDEYYIENQNRGGRGIAGYLVDVIAKHEGAKFIRGSGDVVYIPRLMPWEVLQNPRLAKPQEEYMNIIGKYANPLFVNLEFSSILVSAEVE